MKKCGNGFCKFIETECHLELYFLHRNPNSLINKADAAAAFETLGPKCSKAEEIRREYADVLYESRDALETWRSQSHFPPPLPL